MSDQKKVSKSTQKALDRQLLLIERAILFGRLAVLERQLQDLLPIREILPGRVYIQWWEKFYRRRVVVRLLELNRLLGFNVPLEYSRL